MRDLCDIDGCGEPVTITLAGGAYCRAHYDGLRSWERALEDAETAKTPPRTLTCPRRWEIGRSGGSEEDSWQMRRVGDGIFEPVCSFCGCLDPDVFLQRVREGWIVGPTDKNYKAYLSAPSGTESTGHQWKFYFQHLDAAQIGEFLRLYNDRTMRIGYPGHFYVRPYFAAVA